MPQQKDPNWGTYATYGSEIAAGVGLGALLGWWLDRHYHWSPWGVLAGSGIGIIAGMYAMIRDALRANKD